MINLYDSPEAARTVSRYSHGVEFDPPPKKWSNLLVVDHRVVLPHHLVRFSCGNSGRVKLGGKLARSQVSQARIGPVFIVVTPPIVDPLPGIGHG